MLVKRAEALLLRAYRQQKNRDVKREQDLLEKLVPLRASPRRSPPASPEEELIQQETTLALRGALHLLSQEQQMVIRLRYDEGRSDQEVACALNTTEENVRQLRCRIVRLLGHHLRALGIDLSGAPASLRHC